MLEWISATRVDTVSLLGVVFSAPKVSSLERSLHEIGIIRALNESAGRLLGPPVFFNDRSKAGLLLWILFVNCAILCYTVLFVPCSRAITCWERADLLTVLCVMFLVFCQFRVRCDTWLYRFLIFAFFLTLEATCIDSFLVLEYWREFRPDFLLVNLREWFSDLGSGERKK